MRRGVEVAHYGSCSGDDSFPPTVDVLTAKRSEEKAKKSHGKQTKNDVKPKSVCPDHRHSVLARTTVVIIYNNQQEVKLSLG